MDVDESLKYWRDAGHVARRTLEAMKLELQPGKTFPVSYTHLTLPTNSLV